MIPGSTHKEKEMRCVILVLSWHQVKAQHGNMRKNAEI